MSIAHRNHLWYDIMHILQAWLIPSQIKQLLIFQDSWSILNMLEKCLLIKLMIDYPDNLHYIHQYANHRDVSWIKVNNAFQYIQQVSFLTYVQKNLQQKSNTTNDIFYIEIVNQIKDKL